MFETSPNRLLVNRTGSRLAAAAGLAGVFVGALAATITLQRAGGAWRAELGGYPDEAAHYVTGLMVYDFLRQGAWTDPLGFARAYYAHYPKIGLGHWPPLFYVLQAGWVLVWGPGRMSILLLMAVITAGLATLLFALVRAACGWTLALVAALLLPMLPLVQEATGQVMMDVLVALLLTWAMIAFGRWLETGGAADAAHFTLAATIALYTKQTALALVVAAPLALLLTRRWRLLRTRSLWLAVLGIAVLCGPWYLVSARLVAGSLPEQTGSLAFAARVAGLYGLSLSDAAGFGVFLPALVGFWHRALRPVTDGRWAAAGGWLVGVMVFVSVIPAFEPRYLLPALPPLLLFWAAGVEWLARHVRRAVWPEGGLRFAWVVVGVMGFVVGTFRVPMKHFEGFGPAAELVARTTGETGTVLISSDSRGEGVFIAELMSREARPGRKVVRVSKLLSRSRWGGEDYRALYASPAEAQAAIEAHGVEVVVLDESIPPARRLGHHAQLAEVVASSPDRWKLIATVPVVRRNQQTPDGLRIYRRTPPPGERGAAPVAVVGPPPEPAGDGSL